MSAVEEHSQATLMTVEQAAERLSVSKSIVYGLIEAGKLACHRIGLKRGTIRISASDLDAYLQSTRSSQSAAVKPRRRSKLRHIKL